MHPDPRMASHATPPAPSSRRSAPPKEQVVSSLVAEFMEEVRVEQEAESHTLAVNRRMQRLRRPLVGFLCLGVCLAAWFAPVPGANSGVTPAPTAAFSYASGRLALNLAARRVDAFIARHGRVPTSLEDANVSEPQILLQPQGQKEFVLQLRVGSAVLTYDSSIAPAVQSDDVSTILKTTLK